MKYAIKYLVSINHPLIELYTTYPHVLNPWYHKTWDYLMKKQLCPSEI